jgi:hypothetical protein
MVVAGEWLAWEGNHPRKTPAVAAGGVLDFRFPHPFYKLEKLGEIKFKIGLWCAGVGKRLTRGQ